MSKPTIGFCGMTHLGLTSSIAGASKGFSMVCFDLDPELINSLNHGNLPVLEPQLDNLLSENRSNVLFTSKLSDLSTCDVVYVAPDVPTDDQGTSDLSGINLLLDAIEPALRNDTVLIVLSQVNPGFTRSRGRQNGPLYYQVETLIFGQAVERALNPERYIIGCEDPNQDLPHTYLKFLEAHDCPIIPMRYESAELAKISINMCLVASVSVANTMAEICENIGADWSEIVPSLRLDRRIGQFSYIKPGLGISGGNLERDLASVIRMADHFETDAGVVRAWIANSNHRKNWPYRILQKLLLNDKPNASIAVLGLAYKEDTNSTKNSPALVLIDQLNLDNITVYDPVVPHEKAALSALNAAQGTDAVLLMTPWCEFKNIDPTELAAVMVGRLVIDPYCLLDTDLAQSTGLQHVTLGVTPF